MQAFPGTIEISARLLKHIEDEEDLHEAGEVVTRVTLPSGAHILAKGLLLIKTFPVEGKDYELIGD